MNSQTSEQSSYFATVAESYDRLQPILAGPSYSKGLDMILDLIPFDPDDAFEFVELGCGTAEPSMRVLQHFPHATGICIDSEPEMLALARRKLAPQGSRAQIREGDITCCEIPACDVVLSAKAIHHVSPVDLPSLLARIVQVLRPDGCFILHDAMSVGPGWGMKVRQQSRRFHHRLVQSAVAAGQATQDEIEARWAFKKKMKATGKDVEYRHAVENILSSMTEAGFAEAGIVWRMFDDTILLAFGSGKENGGTQPTSAGDVATRAAPEK